jgi:penicillin-binding protein 2
VGYVGDEGGVVGIEKYYDERLRGIDGNWQIIEDAAGREISKKEIDVAVAGEVLKTNVDLDLQLFVYNVLNQRLLKTGKSGSVVVSRIDGRVEALVSLPSFDPNLFVKNGRRGAEGGTYTESKKVVADEERKPLFNRAVQGSFAPGSVFKMVTALAAISDGGVSKADLIDDDGEIVIGSYRYGNWLFDKYGRTEGQIDLKRAIARSNDIYFYRIGEKMGIDTLIKWAAKYGLGQKTGIDLPGETAGLLPTPLWQEKTKGERWFLGNTFHLSIGQGDLLTSPVQINRMTASLFSNKLCQLNLVNQGKCIDINANKTNLEAVWEGMRAACQPGGTATPFFEFKKKLIASSLNRILPLSS